MKRIVLVVSSLCLALSVIAQPVAKPKVLVRFVVQSEPFLDELGEGAAAVARNAVNRRAECEQRVASAMSQTLHDRFPYLDWVTSGTAGITLTATLLDGPDTDFPDRLIVYEGPELNRPSHPLYRSFDLHAFEPDSLINELKEKMTADVKATYELKEFAQHIPLARSVIVNKTERRVIIPVAGVGADRTTLRVRIPQSGWLYLFEAADDDRGVVSLAKNIDYQDCQGVEWNCMYKYTKGRNDLIVLMDEYRSNQ
jgi:hypothetical protein